VALLAPLRIFGIVKAVLTLLMLSLPQAEHQRAAQRHSISDFIAAPGETAYRRAIAENDFAIITQAGFSIVRIPVRGTGPMRPRTRLAAHVNGTTRYENPSVEADGLNFSDAAEVCWIFGFNSLRHSQAFFGAFVRRSKPASD
jgi:hypothetical protein